MVPTDLQEDDRRVLAALTGEDVVDPPDAPEKRATVDPGRAGEVMGQLAVDSQMDARDLEVAAQLFAERPLGLMERLQDAGADVAQGLADLPTGIVESAGIAAQALGIEGAAMDAKAFSDGMRAFVDEIAPPVQKDAAKEGLQLARALGSGLGFAAGGAIGQVFRLPAWAGAAFAGAAVNAAPAYYETLYKTGDETKAFESWLLNGIVGTSEAIPISRILGRINKASGGGLQKALIDMAIEGGEEFLQEAGQQVAGNIIAQHVTGEEIPILEGMWEGGFTGLFAGVVLSGLGSVVANRIQGLEGQPGAQEQSQAQDAAPLAPGESASTFLPNQPQLQPMPEELLGPSAQERARQAGEQVDQEQERGAPAVRQEPGPSGVPPAAAAEASAATQAESSAGPLSEEEQALEGLKEIAKEIPEAAAGVVSPELDKRAREDALTGLANKGEDKKLTEKAIRERQPGERIVRLRADFDNFKTLNDTKGHEAGDAALQAVAEAWRKIAREEDVVAPSLGRPGGDEFGATLRVGKDADAAAIAQRFEDAANQALAEAGVQEGEAPVGVSVGFAEGEDATAIDRAADQAAMERKLIRGVSKPRGSGKAQALPGVVQNVDLPTIQKAKAREVRTSGDLRWAVTDPATNYVLPTLNTQGELVKAFYATEEQAEAARLETERQLAPRPPQDQRRTDAEKAVAEYREALAYLRAQAPEGAKTPFWAKLTDKQAEKLMLRDLQAIRDEEALVRAIAKRMKKTGESFTAARKGVAKERQAKGGRKGFKARMAAAKAGESGFQTFIRAHGGLAFEPDLERYTPKEALERRAPGLSRLVQAQGSGKGLPIDQALEMALEAGFFPGKALDQLSKQDLLDALESDIGLPGAVETEGRAEEERRRQQQLAEADEADAALNGPFIALPSEEGLFGEQEKAPAPRAEAGPALTGEQAKLFIGEKDQRGQTYLPDVAEAGGAPAAGGSSGAPGFPGAPATIAPPIQGPDAVVRQDPIGRGLFGRLARPKGKIKGVSAPQIIDQLAKVVQVMGQSGIIRVGVGSKRALGFFRVGPEVTRVKVANDIPTAAHEIGHALEKAIYGWPKGGPWRKQLVNKDVRSDLMKLGRALYGDTKPAAGYKREGWAEYIRLWTSEPQSLPAKAPALHAWFEETFLSRHPEVRAELVKAREMIDRWRNLGSAERAKRSMIDPGSPQERMKAHYRDARSFLSVQGWLEMGEPIRKMAEHAAKRKGVRELPGHTDPWLAFQALRTSHAARTRYMIERGMIDPAGNHVGPSLEEAVAPIRGRMEDFTLYLWARQSMLYLNDPRGPREPGLSREDAQQILAELESPEFDIAAGKIMAWNEGMLDYAARSSPAFAAIAEKIRDVHPGYLIPLQREFRQLDRAYGKSSGSAASGSMVKRMKGSGRRIKNPIPALISHAEQMVLKSHQRMVLDRIVQLSKIEGMGHLIEKVPRHRVPVASQTLGGLIDTVQRRLFEASGALLGPATDSEGQEVALDSDILGEIVTFFAPAQQPKQGEDPTIAVWEDGEVAWYVVPNELYRTLGAMDVYRMPKGVELLLGVPAQVMRAGTTGLRASFGLITNPLRDIQTMYMNTRTHAAAPRLLAEWLKRMAHGALGVATGGRKIDVWQDWFLRLGGEMVLPLGQDIPHTRRAARRLFEGPVQRILDPRNAFDTVRDVLQFPESAPRIAEMKLYAKEIGWEPGQPMTLEQSLRLRVAFKQVSTDFTAAGEYARVWNRIAPFHNAALQGPRANVRAFRRNPSRFTLRGLQLTAATLALWYYNRDEEWYKELDLRTKFMYWHIPFTKDGRTELVSIPRSFEVGGMFAALPEMLLDAWYRDDPEQALTWARQFAEVLTPNVEPVLFDELMDQALNRDRFWETPIVPRGEENRPPEEQFGEYTSRVAIFLGGLFKVSPRRIDHAIRGIGGGASADLIDTIGLGPKRKDQEDELADIPVIGKLFRRGGAMGTHPRSIEKVYEALQEAQTLQASVRVQETPEQRQKRLLLSDATKAISALSYARTQAPGIDERRALLQEALSIAQDALKAIEQEDVSFERPAFQQLRREKEAAEKELKGGQ